MDQVEKVKIKLLRNARGSEDGFSVRHFEKDEKVSVSRDLANALIAEGSAEEIGGTGNKGAKSTAKPEYQVGDVVEKDGATYLAIVSAEAPDGIGLLPIDQVTPEEREQLVKEGKLTPEGKAVASAPANKALKGAPANKGQ